MHDATNNFEFQPIEQGAQLTYTVRYPARVFGERRLATFLHWWHGC